MMKSISINYYRTLIFVVLSGMLFLTVVSCRTFHPTSIETSKYRFESSDSYAKDPEMESMITAYRKQLVEETKEVIGTIETQLTKQKPESTLGNFFTDILYEEGKKLWTDHTDFAIQNYGGLRRPFPPKRRFNGGSYIRINAI